MLSFYMDHPSIDRLPMGCAVVLSMSLRHLRTDEGKKSMKHCWNEPRSWIGFWCLKMTTSSGLLHCGSASRSVWADNRRGERVHGAPEHFVGAKFGAALAGAAHNGESHACELTRSPWNMYNFTGIAAFL